MPGELFDTRRPMTLWVFRRHSPFWIKRILVSLGVQCKYSFVHCHRTGPAVYVQDAILDQLYTHRRPFWTSCIRTLCHSGPAVYAQEAILDQQYTYRMPFIHPADEFWTRTMTQRSICHNHCLRVPISKLKMGTAVMHGLPSYCPYLTEHSSLRQPIMLVHSLTVNPL